jgi:hypothetical protein
MGLRSPHGLLGAYDKVPPQQSPVIPCMNSMRFRCPGPLRGIGLRPVPYDPTERREICHAGAAHSYRNNA